MPASPDQIRWIATVLGLQPSQRPAAQDQPESDDPLMLAERIQDARLGLARLVKAESPVARDIARLYAAAAKLVETKAAAAGASVDELESALARAMSALRSGEVSQATAVSVDFRKLLIDWHAAQNTAQQEVTKLGEAYLSNPEVQEDPRFTIVQSVVGGLHQHLPEFGNQLDTDINLLLNTGGKSADAAKAAMQTLGSYRDKLAGATTLQRIEAVARQDLGVDVNAFGTLDRMLGDIETKIKAIA